MHRILAISFLFPSSAAPNRGIFVLNRLRAISKECTIKVINPIPWFPFQRFFKRYQGLDSVPQVEVIDGIEIFHPRFFSIPFTFKLVTAICYSISAYRLARQIHREFDFDLVDLHWTFPDLPAGRLIASRFQKKQLVTVRGTPALHLKEWGSRSFLVRKLLPKSDAIITLSQRLKDHCLAMGAPSQRTTVIRNGVDAANFNYLKMRDCRHELELPIDRTIVLGVGFLARRKGFDRLIRAIATINRPDVHLYLIGPGGAITVGGDRSHELWKLASNLGVESQVHFVGEVPNTTLIKWYNAADLFCLSSRDEGSPNVLGEALSCGCPSVATDVGAVPDMMTSEALGVVCENSTEGVLSGLQTALSRAYDRQQISKEVKRYDWKWCADQVINIYEHVKQDAVASATDNPGK